MQRNKPVHPLHLLPYKPKPHSESLSPSCSIIAIIGLPDFLVPVLGNTMACVDNVDHECLLVLEGMFAYRKCADVPHCGNGVIEKVNKRKAQAIRTTCHLESSG